MAANLQAKLSTAAPSWVEELQLMVGSGHKAEIEAVYGVCGADGFSELLVRALEEGGFI